MTVEQKKLKDLKDIITEFTGIDIENVSGKKSNVVFAKALYFGLAVELFSVTHEEAGRSIGKKRGNVTHALLNIYPYLEKDKPEYYALKYDIIRELDRRNTSKYLDLYIPSEFVNTLEILRNLPEGSIEAINFKLETMVKIEEAKLKNIDVTYLNV